MMIKGITTEDFVNYKLPSMFVATATCTFKCDKECGRPVCQNSSLVNQPSMFINSEVLADRYVRNKITKAVVFGGLEPMDQFDSLLGFLLALRTDLGWECHDDVVIYTGYTKEELEREGKLETLRKFDNIIVKFGRFIPDQTPHFDPVLGVDLASDNQFAERIS